MYLTNNNLVLTDCLSFRRNLNFMHFQFVEITPEIENSTKSMKKMTADFV
jgi:hypothetical protein